jgi:hypothetical protein
MNVQPLAMTQEAAAEAVQTYKAHRATYDARDWEIERIYRAIAKGRTVISAHDAIRAGGVDELGRPRLAIMRADQQRCRCDAWFSASVKFYGDKRTRSFDLNFEITWRDRGRTNNGHLEAQLPRIPPQHRPPATELAKYHVLWEADWTAIPRDPYLLKRIGKDAWVVLAAWDLTDVEISVLRSHQAAR